jgi:hypothetical protein
MYVMSCRRIEELKKFFDIEQYRSLDQLSRTSSNLDVDVNGHTSHKHNILDRIDEQKVNEPDHSDEKSRLVNINSDRSDMMSLSPIRALHPDSMSTIFTPSIDVVEVDLRHDHHDQISSTPQPPFTTQSRARLWGSQSSQGPTSLHVQHIFLKKIEYWMCVCDRFQQLQTQLKTTMKRNEAFQKSNQTFAESFARECLRNFVHVYTQQGTLRVVAAQIINLPEVGKNLHIKISYGTDVSVFFKLVVLLLWSHLTYLLTVCA